MLAETRDISQEVVAMPLQTISIQQDFFQFMRRIEQEMHWLPRFGVHLECDRKRLQIRQTADFSFAARELALLAQHIEPSEHSSQQPAVCIQLEIRHFGLFAPYGALPIEITEEIRQERFFSGQRAFEDFLNLPITRLATQYYRAWSQLKESIGHDRGDDNSFLRRLSCAIGASPETPCTPHIRRLRQAFPGAYSHRRCSLPQLQKLLSHYFSQTIRIFPRAAGWITTPSSVSRGALRLGQLSLGQRFFDAQHRIAIHIGPVSASDYLDWQRRSERLQELEDIVRDFVGHRVVYRIVLLVATTTTMKMNLKKTLLGSTSWLKPGDGIHPQPLRDTNFIQTNRMTPC